MLAIWYIPVAREGMAVSRCQAALEGSHLELEDSRLGLEGSLLEGRWPQDKGEVVRPFLRSYSVSENYNSRHTQYAMMLARAETCQYRILP